jgi:hypothetical protein
MPPAGTAVLGTGGGGTSFYTSSPGGQQIATDLLLRGFRVVERRWASGWFESGTSVRLQSCRYATLITWIKATFHSGGAFCVTGNSGGSAEIGYALSTWGRGSIIDVAVPSGGPPLSRLDFLCLNAPPWPSQCHTIVPPGTQSCTPGCTVTSNHPVCTACSPTPTAADLLADSILFPGAATAYSSTRVHFLFGELDCGSAVPAGMLFANAITTEKVIEFVENTPHDIRASVEGREAVVRAIVAGAACRPGPATLGSLPWPQVGGVLDVDLHGPVSAAWWLWLGFNRAFQPLPPLGIILIEAPIGPIAAGLLDASGRATWFLSIPPDPALAGIEGLLQSLTGFCLTNVERVVIRP